MAGKQVKAKKGLALDLSNLSDRLGEVTTVLERPGGMIQKLEQVAGMLDTVCKRQEEIKNFLGTVAFPADAMNELTGELRAVRQLLDEKGEYAFMDKARLRVARGLPKKNGGR